jgi:predicted DNA-binding transcriptional regulator YafY
LDVRAIPLEAPRGWVELHWTIDPNAEFMELLMRLRNSFRIVAPNSLKKQYKKRLLELLKAID